MNRRNGSRCAPFTTQTSRSGRGPGRWDRQRQPGCQLRWYCLGSLVLSCLLSAAPVAAQRQPDVGYVYPAGGQRGTTVSVTVGGQFLDGANAVYISGDGVTATIGKYDKPLSQREVGVIRNKLEEARQKQQQSGAGRPAVLRPGNYRELLRLAEQAGVTPEDLRRLMEYRRQRLDPKRQPNPQLDEKITLEVALAENAPPGRRELRLKTATGLSDALAFYVSPLPEHVEREPNSKGQASTIDQPLPVVINGQILPGDVDRFRFAARQGQRLVAAVAAREITPYLADAVPGWFQATVTLFDAHGQEVAFADDFRFQPDPVLYYEIPADGNYELQINDAIYRGREDFVYRITLGELPYITSIYPLGGSTGRDTSVEVRGWNLPVERATIPATSHRELGIQAIAVGPQQPVAHPVLFAVDSLAEQFEREPNGDLQSAQAVQPPVVINGRIDEPGDRDVFRFAGRAGGRISLEVFARRLSSPVDSLLKLTTADGELLAANDDHEDKTAGLTTHHADSLVEATLPADGTYCIQLEDTQHKGGSEFGYRLRISAQRPDFVLRVVPATISARTGQTVPVTVHAMRQDGFDGEIQLALKGAPQGFWLSGSTIPAGQDQVRMTLSVPNIPRAEPVRLQLEGSAVVDGRPVRHRAVPAEDMTQAFAYHHLVAESDWLVSVMGPPRARAAVRGRGPAAGLGQTPRGMPPAWAAIGRQPLKLPVGGVAERELPVVAGRMLAALKLELSDAPEGISLDETVGDAARITIRVRADAQQVKPGQQGNLIINAFWERSFPGQNGQPATRRRVPLGALPAIPYEIVDAD